MEHPLKDLFEPKSIAILGASENPSKSGYQFLDKLIRSGYKGKLYPVNPKGGNALGIPFYKALEEIGEPIDLVLNLLSAKNSRQAMESIGKSGAKFAYIFTSGFAEMGPEGKKMQDDMLEIARSYGVRFVGPNCMGMFNLDIDLNMDIYSHCSPKGPIGIVTQSGGIATTAFDNAAKLNTGFTKWMHFGNQADIPVYEYLDYMGKDESTKVVAVYLEGLKPGQGKKFIETVREVSKKKPVVVLKGGHTESGKRATASHTASMAGTTEVFSAALKKAGAIEVSCLEELIPVAETLSRCPVCKGKTMGIVGSGGGHSIMLSDALEESGFKVSAFADETVSKIAAKLPVYAPNRNPIDMTGEHYNDMELYGPLTEYVYEDPAEFAGTVSYVGAGVEILKDVHGKDFSDTARVLGELQKKTQKPTIFYAPMVDEYDAHFTAFREAGIPAYGDVRIAARCMKALYERYEIERQFAEDDAYAEMSVQEDARAILKGAENRSAKNLTEAEALRFLSENGIGVLPHGIAHTAKEAAEIAERIGYPVTMKIVSPDIIHKSDVGGVILKRRNAEEVEQAFDAMSKSIAAKCPAADVHGILVTQHKDNGTELILGTVKDNFFGQTLMVGFGGIYTEVFRDIRFNILPVSRSEIERNLRELRCFPVLEGARGQKKQELSSIVEFIYKFAQMADAYSDISEMDINPVLITEDGIYPADARIIVK